MTKAQTKAITQQDAPGERGSCVPQDCCAAYNGGKVGDFLFAFKHACRLTAALAVLVKLSGSAAAYL
jgi:hypothetical protein